MPLPALQKRFVELDGGVSRVAGLLDTLAAADRMQAAAARARADAMLSNGAAGETACPSLVVCPAADFGSYTHLLCWSPVRVLSRRLRSSKPMKGMWLRR